MGDVRGVGDVGVGDVGAGDVELGNGGVEGADGIIFALPPDIVEAPLLFSMKLLTSVVSETNDIFT